MIETKLFELRDRGTFIPIFAFRNFSTLTLNKGEWSTTEHKREAWLLRRCGFLSNASHVTIGRLECGDARSSECTYDVYGHSGSERIWQTVHKHIEENWDSLRSGDLLDVEFILGETTQPKVSEQEGS